MTVLLQGSRGFIGIRVQESGVQDYGIRVLQSCMLGRLWSRVLGLGV